MCASASFEMSLIRSFDYRLDKRNQWLSYWLLRPATCRSRTKGNSHSIATMPPTALATSASGSCINLQRRYHTAITLIHPNAFIPKIRRIRQVWGNKEACSTIFTLNSAGDALSWNARSTSHALQREWEPRNLQVNYPVFLSPAEIPLIVAAMARFTSGVSSPARLRRSISTWIKCMGST